MLSAQLQADSPLHDRFEEFRDVEGFESKSEAVRAALRLGLDDYESDDGPDRSATDELLLSTASNLATIAIVVALVAAAGLLSPAAGALIGGVSLLSALMLIGEVRYRAVRTLSPLGAPKEVTE
jgi:Arc/MetJ-type ribon-helix-helix transcriptional regulator